ncbi:MAG: type II secretion system protein, partial [Candidatus Paceibacterota bacterium]
MKRKINKKAGFTLIEIMVSVAIFSVVMLIAIGALLSVNDSNRKARALRVVMDNLNFAVEDMSKKMRTGSDFYCKDGDLSDYVKGDKKDCAGGASQIVFKFKKKTDSQEELIAYWLDRGISNNKGMIKSKSVLPNTGTSLALADSYYMTSP